MKLLTYGLLLGGLATSHSASAQVPDTAKFICPGFFEPIPELPGGGGTQGIVKAIQRRIIYPPDALAAAIEGRVFVSFAVTPAGEVVQVSVVKPLWPSCDSTSVSALRNLPCFKPRPEKYGSMSFTTPITFQLDDGPPASHRPHHPTRRKPTPRRNPNP